MSASPSDPEEVVLVGVGIVDNGKSSVTSDEGDASHSQTSSSQNVKGPSGRRTASVAGSHFTLILNEDKYKCKYFRFVYHIHILQFPSVSQSVSPSVCSRLPFYWKELRSFFFFEKKVLDFF